MSDPTPFAQQAARLRAVLSEPLKDPTLRVGPVGDLHRAHCSRLRDGKKLRGIDAVTDSRCFCLTAHPAVLAAAVHAGLTRDLLAVGGMRRLPGGVGFRLRERGPVQDWFTQGRSATCCSPESIVRAYAEAVHPLLPPEIVPPPPSQWLRRFVAAYRATFHAALGTLPREARATIVLTRHGLASARQGPPAVARAADAIYRSHPLPGSHGAASAFRVTPAVAASLSEVAAQVPTQDASAAALTVLGGLALGDESAQELRELFDVALAATTCTTPPRHRGRPLPPGALPAPCRP